jgi:hypothetical protein
MAEALIGDRSLVAGTGRLGLLKRSLSQDARDGREHNHGHYGPTGFLKNVPPALESALGIEIHICCLG